MKTTVNIDGKEVNVFIKFNHHIIDQSTIHKMGYWDVGSTRELNGTTECKLVLDGVKEITTTSYCSVGDQFCKATGRKIALTRAVKEAGLPKSERTKIWNEYVANATV